MEGFVLLLAFAMSLALVVIHNLAIRVASFEAALAFDGLVAVVCAALWVSLRSWGSKLLQHA